MKIRLVSHVRSNVIAYLALFIALGGTSYAAVRLTPGSVGTVQLRNGAVTTQEDRERSNHSERTRRETPSVESCATGRRSTPMAPLRRRAVEPPSSVRLHMVAT